MKESITLTREQLLAFASMATANVVQSSGPFDAIVGPLARQVCYVMADELGVEPYGADMEGLVKVLREAGWFPPECFTVPENLSGEVTYLEPQGRTGT